MTLPNLLSCLRLFIGPCFLFIYQARDSLGITSHSLPFYLFGLILLAELSDVADGYFARKRQEVTSFGKIFDPMTDSLYRITIFLTFTLPPVNLPLYPILIFLYRDIMISALRTICALEGFTLAARPSGKLKAIIQSIAIFAILFLLTFFLQGEISQESLTHNSTIIATLTAFYALISGIEYLYSNRRYLHLK